MAIIGIVAVDRNLAIGKDGRVPWHYSADMKFFKQTTIGNTVVMGRRTWLTLPGPLKDRQNIVLSRQDLQSQDSVVFLGDIDSVLNLTRKEESHLFVIGGAQVYESFRAHIERWIVTEVPLAVEGADIFMPANFLDGFKMYELRQLDEGLRVKFYERGPSNSTLVRLATTSLGHPLPKRRSLQNRER
jgi:dihydrofolate reductase